MACAFGHSLFHIVVSLTSDNGWQRMAGQVAVAMGRSFLRSKFLALKEANELWIWSKPKDREVKGICPD
jgi:hypothetical protein